MNLTMTESDREILDSLKDSDAFREAAEEVEREKHAERAEAIAELSELNSKAEIETPKLIKRRDESIAKYLKVRESLEKADEVARLARSDLWNFSVRKTARTDKLERELLDSSDSKVQSLINVWNDENERICRRVPALVWESETGLFKRATGVPELVRSTNRPQLDAVMLEISTAVKKLESLRFADQTNLEKSIEMVVGDLPQIGEVTTSWRT